MSDDDETPFDMNMNIPLNFSINGWNSQVRSIGLNHQILQIENKYQLLGLKSSDDVRVCLEATDSETGQRVEIEKLCDIFKHNLGVSTLRQLQIYRGLSSCIGIRKLINIMIPVPLPASFEEEQDMEFNDVYLVYGWMSDFDLLLNIDSDSPKCTVELQEEEKEEKDSVLIGVTKGQEKDSVLTGGTKGQESIVCKLWQLVNALNHLHLAHIVHGSVDQVSVVISSDAKYVQLYNFMWSAPENETYIEDGNAAEDEEKIRSMLSYCAPEILLGRAAYNTTAFDVWCVGCLFREMLKGRVQTLRIPAGRALTVENQLIHILYTLRPSVEDIYFMSPETTTSSKINLILQQYREEAVEEKDKDGLASDLLGKLMSFDPSKRISAQEALKHPYFDTEQVYLHMDDESLETKLAALSEASHLEIIGNKLEERNQIRDLIWEQMLSFHGLV